MLYLPTEAGQGLVEYGLILVLVSIAAIAVMVTLGESVRGIFQTVSDSLEEASD